MTKFELYLLVMFYSLINNDLSQSDGLEKIRDMGSYFNQSLFYIHGAYLRMLK